MICGEACPATASGTCGGNFSTFIKGGRYIFSLNEAKLLTKQEEEGGGQKRQGG